ncbi:hypothetical protein [Nitrosospira sp. NRS527]|uniref:hypothetical protein n=1 Tax=Nitrosospira sp. NRS527 TaxID=155925 RepID=UPI001AF3D319|nr:hypothetical protein [Nitrosospira sp. NRS527]BCT66556.1 hypothetical protein NNRS527_00120 [Nitrosospira sp. NRS527]
MDVRNIQHATSDTDHVRLSELLKSEDWPTPKWYVGNKARKIQTYEEHFTFQLRARYLELENDFRTVLGNSPDVVDFITAARISDILRSARECLEQETTELLTVSSSLDLVERYMVWLYPPWAGKARITGILLRLESLSFNGRDFLIKKLTELSESDKEAYPGQLRSVLDETIGLINAQVIQDRIGRGLQINRLKALRLWGSGILLIFFTVSPLATNFKNIGGWPSQLIFGQSAELSTWMNAFAMMTLGALGGFLSGLLQAQSTQVTLTEYLENMLKLQLRPLIGALVALILYTFLSWQVLPGITIVNAGSYFVLAFLSGFSERYFLRLLKTESQESSEENKTPKQTNLTGS